MKNLRRSRLKKELLFQSGVILMIALTRRIGFVRAAPSHALQTSANASGDYAAKDGAAPMPHGKRPCVRCEQNVPGNAPDGFDSVSGGN